MSRITPRKRHTIRRSQAQELMAGLREQIGEAASLFPGDRMEILETDAGISLYLIDKKPMLMHLQGMVFPTLRGLLEHPFPGRRVVVDSGAVPFVIKGADVMRPGITSISDDIRAGMPVQVVEERHGKPIALGIALFDAGEMREKRNGKVIKTKYYVGDDLWSLEM
ncbi:MAG: RNA-binding protein [Methanolinea sp.]|nr:RNA-binding protein [Methanolinea sp.]